ncbi:MAG TPA: DUF447 domain-containing protein [Pirellulaceae bacterium]|jgi:hypothetical protein|nr:DUF447 domain-containing protein [Pirellulaceae bacterium]
MSDRSFDDASLSEGPICEGIVTTQSEGGDASPYRVAPMGPRVLGDYEELLLRPFRSSQTYRNLREQGRGAFHVTDDVDLIARAAVGRLDTLPAAAPFEIESAVDVSYEVFYLADCCRRFAFEVVELDDSAERTRIRCRVVHREEVRPFFGFCRAQFACLELAILATRRHLYSPEVLAEEIVRLETIVDKTAGPKERATFAMLQKSLQETNPSNE